MSLVYRTGIWRCSALRSQVAAVCAASTKQNNGARAPVPQLVSKRCFSTTPLCRGLELSTLITSKAANAKLEDLLKSIRPIAIPQKEQAAIFLVTPPLAKLFNAENGSLGQILQKLFAPTAATTDRVFAAVAVVDRIPLWGRKKPLRAEADGISMSILDVNGIRNLNPSSLLDSARVPNVDEPAVIDIYLKEGGIRIIREETTSRVQLPLANTIFTSGRRSTLFLSEYVANKDATSLDLLRTKHLARLQTTLGQEDLHFWSTMTADCDFITPRKQIAAGMGNIVRQLSASSGQEDTTQPASAELEKCVPKYLEKHPSFDGRLEVWAMLEPRLEGIEDLPSLKDVPEPASGTSLRRQGIRVHKVLSGGGGWGKKAGLLSLDPETSFGTSQEQEGESMDLDSPFPEIFDIGDSIQFLTDRPCDLEPEPKLQWVKNVFAEPKIIFGASSRLPLLEVPERRLNFFEEEELDVFPEGKGELFRRIDNYFGATSDHGVVMQQTKKLALEVDGKGKISKYDIPGFCAVFSQIRLNNKAQLASLPDSVSMSSTLKALSFVSLDPPEASKLNSSTSKSGWTKKARRATKEKLAVGKEVAKAAPRKAAQRPARPKLENIPDVPQKGVDGQGFSLTFVGRLEKRDKEFQSHHRLRKHEERVGEAERLRDEERRRTMLQRERAHRLPKRAERGYQDAPKSSIAEPSVPDVPLSLNRKSLKSQKLVQPTIRESRSKRSKR